MKANVWKSELGNRVVVSLGDHILLEFDGKTYIFTNPDNPGIFAGQVRQIEWSIKQTPEQIIAEARKAYETSNSDNVPGDSDS